MKQLISLSLAAFMLASCITERRRADIFHGYANEHRSEVLKYCPPPIEKVNPGTPDTVTIVDTVKVKVPYPVPGTNDTIWVDCPDTEYVYRYISKTDTLFRENTAELERQSLLRQDAEKEAAIASELAALADKRAKERLYWIIGLAIGLIASVILKIKNFI